MRGDSSKKKIAIVFTGDEFGDGAAFNRQTLAREKVKASFFLTGRYYRNKKFQKDLLLLKKDGHYFGAHSDAHLLYCDWSNRDSLLVTRQEFIDDLAKNYEAMRHYGITKNAAPYFLPPYEWYNDSISAWTKQMGFQLINYTPGTLSHADYTTPADRNYRSSEVIYNSITSYEKSRPAGLNGFILLMHIGTDEKRTDKFYNRLPELLRWMKSRGYELVTINELMRIP